jgi:hypothetical protein
MPAMKKSAWSRRQMLRGAGVALSLPWLEALAPRRARGQTPTPRRYVSLYFPNGTANYWRPSAVGTGDAWQLSPIMAPLAPVKSRMLAVGNVSNTAPFMTADDPDGTNLLDSHPMLAASTWTATAPNWLTNGISVDQVIANAIAASPAATPIHSLQLGLSTQDSVIDILPAVHARSISWRSESEPLYKVVNPQAVFDRLVAADTAETNDPAAEQRRALRKSALDYLQDSTLGLQAKLGKSDRVRLDGFLSSVRSLETRVQPRATVQPRTPACSTMPRPPEPYSVASVPSDYNRDTHAALMNDLIVMAFACDRTRVVSHMLDDGRSLYEYAFLQRRVFTPEGSTEGTGVCGPYHVLQHSGDTNDEYATVGYWMCRQAADLAGKLAAISEGETGSMLDNSVIVFASGMNGGNHLGIDLPIVLLGGGGGVLKQGAHLRFAAERQLGELHLTLMRHVFGCRDTFFGRSTSVVEELLA